MKIKNTLKFIAAPSKVFMTIVILLFVLFIVQIITIELIKETKRAFESDTEKKDLIAKSASRMLFITLPSSFHFALLLTFAIKSF